MKALSRSAACALGVRALLVLPASPLFPLPASGFQADDKSFSLAVSPAWQLDPAPPRVAQPDSVLFRVVGSDAAGGRFEATVEPSPKKQLGELGSLDAVAQRYLALQPQPAALLGATTVPRPNMFGLQMYELRFSTGRPAQQRLVRLALTQSRLYQLVVSLPAEPTPELAAEAEALVASFEAYPLNIGCLRGSNAGAVLPGVCY